MFLLDFREEPGAGVIPVPFRRGVGDVEGSSCLFAGQSREITKFDELGLKRVSLGQFCQGFI